MKGKQNTLKKIFCISLAGALILALGQVIGAGEEEYDEFLYGPAAPIIWTKPVVGVIFEHKPHTYELGLDCDSCHDGLFEMVAGAAEENDDFTMESLYQGKYCGACHDGSMAFASNTRCTACHIGVKGYNRSLGTK
jgi:c(7)-type cytochrome triheme protein